MPVGAFALPLVDPPAGTTYPHLLRGTGPVWRPLLGVASGLSLYVLLVAVIGQVVLALAWWLTARDTPYVSYATSAARFEVPAGMLAANLGIASLLVVSAAMVVVVHQVRPTWLSSVTPGLRWRYLLPCLGVATVALLGVLALSTLVTPVPGFRAQPGFWAFLVVIVLTSPLQAAAEEYFFRGYLFQALGAVFARASAWVAVVGSALLFALFHGVQNPALFADRLAFGLLAAVLVWRTGGLEAAIAAHVVNNVCAYLLAGLTTSIADVRATREIGWVDAAFDVGGFALFAVLAWLLARRMGLRATVAPGSRTGLG